MDFAYGFAGRDNVRKRLRFFLEPGEAGMDPISETGGMLVAK